MSMADTIPSMRRASVADAEALARGVVAGVADYPAFAPPGWSGPTYDEELAHHRGDLPQEHFHCIVAEVDGAVVGQITVVPAALAGNPVDDPALGHVRNLVAAGQARARAFYEREGWRPAGDPFGDPVPGLLMVEYRRLT